MRPEPTPTPPNPLFQFDELRRLREENARLHRENERLNKLWTAADQEVRRLQKYILKGKR